MGALLPVNRPYLGLVGTRSGLHHDSSLGTSTYNARCGSYSRSWITNIQVAFWNGGHNGTAETAGGATATYNASIEFPVGTFTQLLFKGSNAGTVASGGIIYSDLMPVRPIPPGSLFYVRYRQSGGSTFWCSTVSNTPYQITGEGISATTTDLTMSGTITDDSGGTLVARPLAILGYTTRPSFAMLGDSILAGTGESGAGTFGDIGAVAHTAGLSYAYTDLATPSEAASAYLSGNTARLAIAKHASHIICNYGINDLINGRTTAQIQADLQTIASQLAPRPFYACTLLPYTTGAWTATNGSDQTDAGQATNIATMNTWIRGMPGHQTGILDIRTPIINPNDANKWNAPGYTTDGIHPTSTANGLMGLVDGVLSAPRAGIMPRLP